MKCKVTVKKAPSKITLNKTKLTINVGNTLTLKKTLPSGTASYKVTYTSSNKSVATVSSAGKITPKKAGTVTITAKTFNGKKATCKVTVTAKRVYSNKMQQYNEKKYYTSVFHEVMLDAKINLTKKLGTSYIALPVFSKIDIDNFIIYNNVIYFIDQSSNSGGETVSTLYKCKMDGSNLTKIASELYQGFAIEGNKLIFSRKMCYLDNYGNFEYQSIITNPGHDNAKLGNLYAYDLSSEKITRYNGTFYLKNLKNGYHYYNQNINMNTFSTFDNKRFYFQYEHDPNSYYNYAIYCYDIKNKKTIFLGRGFSVQC